MAITFPDNTTDKIDQMRAVIGRDVDFYIPSYSGCSTCTLDPVSQESTDSFCPTCSGIYWIPTFSATTKSGHITWAGADILDWRVGGQLFDGDVRIQIKKESGTISMLDDTEYIIVDSKKVEEKSRILRGVQEINRVLLDCILVDKEA